MRTDLELHKAKQKLAEAAKLLEAIKESKDMYRTAERELLDPNLTILEREELTEFRNKCLIMLGKLDVAYINTSLDAVFMPDNHGVIQN